MDLTTHLNMFLTFSTKQLRMRLSLKVVCSSFLIFTPLYIFSGTIFRQEVPATLHTDIDLKNILIWTNPTHEPIAFLGKGRTIFEKYNCFISNCYVTSDRKHLNEVTDFDVILFHGPELATNRIILPTSRSLHQQYVFVSMESSHYYPMRTRKYNNYFNWTWTYKLSSDLYYGYMIVRNKQGDVIGPSKTMHWLDPKDMQPIDEDLKKELSNKELAAAWFVSNCKTPGKRENFTKELKMELKKYNLTLDIYGKCGDKKCNKYDKINCEGLVKSSYYFYLSFENSFSEDYVTEKLLTALLNNAVPVVYGGANYTRFVPDGAYLNARELGVKELVRRMVDAINNKETYYNYFKWRNHYSYHDLLDSLDTNVYCKLCSMANKNLTDVAKITSLQSHKYFAKWWNS